MKEIQFASKLPVAADRYRKKIAQEEDARNEQNMMRSSIVGGAMGHLFRHKIPLSHSGAILAGIGAGALTQAGVRMANKKRKDQYGDLPLSVKKAETLPWKLGGLAAAGIIGYRGYRRINMSARGRTINFSRSEQAMARATLAYEDRIRQQQRDAASAHRYGEDLWRKAGRTKRIIRDVTKKVKGEKLVDSRGREYTPEWQKPWAKTAMGVGALGLATLAVRKGWRGVRQKADALRKVAPVAEHSGVAGAYNRLRDFFVSDKGRRAGMSAYTTKHGPLANHPTARRAIVQARVAKREFRRVADDVKDIGNDKLDSVVDKIVGNTGANSVTGRKAIKTQQEIEKHNAIQSRVEDIIGMPIGAKVPPLTSKYAVGKKPRNEREFSSEQILIQLAERSAWEISQQYGNQLLLAPPGTKRRNRGPKTETIDEERERRTRDKYIFGGTTAAVTGAGTYAGMYFSPSARRARQAAEDARDFVQSGGQMKVVGGEGSLLKEAANEVKATRKRRMGGVAIRSKIGKTIGKAATVLTKK